MSFDNNMQKEKQITVILADDSKVFLETAIRFFKSDASNRINILKTAADGFEAIEFTALLNPDVLVMDLNMPGMNGLEATRIIKNLINPPKIIIISIFEAPADETLERRTGADRFLCKIIRV